MKAALLSTILALITVAVQAQFYISGSGGYSLPSAGVKFGTETTATTIENSYGSYGEGLHGQLRLGYFFSDHIGVEVGIGYLNGADQTVTTVNVPTQPLVDIKARGRAFGTGVSVRYKFNNNIYGRFGALIKIGGRTEAIGSIEGIVLPAGVIQGVPIATTLDFNFEQHYHGKLPLGFVGAIGYTHNLNDKIGIFAELEYMGISITRNDANMEVFSATLREIEGATLTIDQVRGILAASGNSLASALYDDIDFVDDISTSNTDGSIQLAQKVPYSSIGLNFGITFTFGSAQ